jgi:glutamate-ammonia-ligase adenylyltransferase
MASTDDREGDRSAVLAATERYRALADAVGGPHDLGIAIEPAEASAWTVAVATADRPGALALIVGALTAHRLDVRTADVRTLPPVSSGPARARSLAPEQDQGTRPRGHPALVPHHPTPGWENRGTPPYSRPGPARDTSSAQRPVQRLLDVFTVWPAAEAAPDWPARLRTDLRVLLAERSAEEAREEIIDRVSETFRQQPDDGARLLPISVTVDDRPPPNGDRPSTGLTVRSADLSGFLFAFASALTSCGINVERAEVHTIAGEAHDTFWVTDAHGRPITDPAALAELRVAIGLIKHFTYLLPRSPNPGQALRQFIALVSQMRQRPDWTAELTNLESPDVLERLAEVMGVSRFLWEDFLRMQHASLFPLLLDAAALAAPRPPAALRAELRSQLAAAESPAARVNALNAFKDRELFRIDLRHLVGRSDFAGFAGELTALAEVAVEEAAALAEAELRERYGAPTLADGQPCRWCLYALGKFAGGELGFGSDLELNLLYAGQGRTSGPTSLVNSEYFGLLVQRFRDSLRAREAGIFEIDLRLRPYGRAGALATSWEGFTSYYRAGGGAAQFERLALVRLRPVAGDAGLGARVAAARDAFVYSGQPLDLDNVRHLRHRQATELVPRGEVNAKYSAGGLVDLEYFVQAWQITAGATDARVRVPNTRAAIDRLAAGGYLDPRLAATLTDTYDFLRQLIDALRVVRGHARDLSIPAETTREFAYLARRLRLPDPAALHQAIATRMAFARELWADPHLLPMEWR